MTWGEIIRRIRESKGLTQQNIADELGVNTTTIIRWEQEGKIKSDQLEKLAKAFGMEIGDLFGEAKKIAVDDQITIEFKPLVRDGGPVAAISVRILVDKTVNSDIFMCIPIDNAELQKQFEKQVNKRFINWLAIAYAKASSEVIADLYAKK